MTPKVLFGETPRDWRGDDPPGLAGDVDDLQ